MHNELRCRLLTDHRGTEETQYLANRIRDCRGTAAGEKKTDRVRICRHIFHHQRTGVAAVEEFAPFIRHHDLTCDEEIVPISRMEPSVRTSPLMTLAMEQSTLVLGSELFFTKVPTCCAPAEEQFTSIKPG
jgi:hypothetical protein